MVGGLVMYMCVSVCECVDVVGGLVMYMCVSVCVDMVGGLVMDVCVSVCVDMVGGLAELTGDTADDSDPDEPHSGGSHSLSQKVDTLIHY